MRPFHHHLLAFRRGVGTMDCVSTLLAGVFGTKAVIVFLNLGKAFELASAPAILALLAAKGVGRRLLAWIGDYLGAQGCREISRPHVRNT